MITYKALQADRRQFLALTGLTLSEFQRLLTVFPQAYRHIYPADQTAEGQPRQRAVGGGCKWRLEQPEAKLLNRVGYRSPTVRRCAHGKVVADVEGLSYRRARSWYKESRCQGYEPAVRRT